ncbi:MAG: hypothetical protein J5716_06090 [Alphaproteobacteria bacterium]|nr:hypothetical protein [Alphaproteobacteria bacterium]
MSKMTPKKAAWYNRRAKMLGGYATMSPINTNKAADIYYRKSAGNRELTFLFRTAWARPPFGLPATGSLGQCELWRISMFLLKA